MDGTLIDQTQPIIRCYAEVIESMGYPLPEADIIRRSMGGPMASTMALFVEEDRLDEAGRAFRRRFPEIMFEGLIVLPGALELIEAFAKHEIPQAILTNKHGETARAVSEHCGFGSLIKTCVGSGDTEWGKPQAELTQFTLKKLKAAPDNSILIGDSPTDVATAQEADLKCYGVATGAHSIDELLEAGAAAAFPDLPTLQSAFVWSAKS